MTHAALQDLLFWIVIFFVMIFAISGCITICLTPIPDELADKKRIKKAIRLYPQVEILIQKRLDSGEVVTNFDLDKIVEEVSLNCWKKTNIERQRRDVGEVSS